MTKKKCFQGNEKIDGLDSRFPAFAKTGMKKKTDWIPVFTWNDKKRCIYGNDNIGGLHSNFPHFLREEYDKIEGFYITIN